MKSIRGLEIKKDRQKNNPHKMKTIAKTVKLFMRFGRFNFSVFRHRKNSIEIKNKKLKIIPFTGRVEIGFWKGFAF